MQIEQLINNLTSKLKIPIVYRKDENGIHHLKIGVSPEIAIRKLDIGIFLSAPIFPIPKEENKEALFIYLMKANLMGQGTGGATIGIDSSETFFTLTLTLPFEVDDTLFYERLEDYVNFIDYWKEEIPSFLKSHPIF